MISVYLPRAFDSNRHSERTKKIFELFSRSDLPCNYDLSCTDGWQSVGDKWKYLFLKRKEFRSTHIPII